MKTQGDVLKLTNWNWDTKLAAESFSANLQGAFKHLHHVGLSRNHQIQIVGDFNKRRKSMRKTEKWKFFFLANSTWDFSCAETEAQACRWSANRCSGLIILTRHDLSNQKIHWEANTFQVHIFHVYISHIGSYVSRTQPPCHHYKWCHYLRYCPSSTRCCLHLCLHLTHNLVLLPPLKLIKRVFLLTHRQSRPSTQPWLMPGYFWCWENANLINNLLCFCWLHIPTPDTCWESKNQKHRSKMFFGPPVWPQWAISARSHTASMQPYLFHQPETMKLEQPVWSLQVRLDSVSATFP